MVWADPTAGAFYSRFPHGKRGLKFAFVDLGLNFDGRFPHGKRGLKFDGVGQLVQRLAASLAGSVD